MGSIDEHELRALFEEIEAPPALDRWRDRIADVPVELYEREPDPFDVDDEDADEADSEISGGTDSEISGGTDSEISGGTDSEISGGISGGTNSEISGRTGGEISSGTGGEINGGTNSEISGWTGGGTCGGTGGEINGGTGGRTGGEISDGTGGRTGGETSGETDDETGGAKVIVLPIRAEPRPKPQRRRSVAVAASVAVVVGLSGIVVASTLLSDSPPADPTMIIDGPDRTVTSLPLPTAAATTNPSGTPTTRLPDTRQSQTRPGDGGTSPGQPTGGLPRAEDPGVGFEASWPPMSGDPTAANTGVPLGATLGDHYGNLLVTSPGQVVSDLRVTGTVIVDAPNVTLKRVLVVAPNGAPAVRQNASGLTVVNSELTGGSSLVQAATGLKINRSRLQYGVTITTGAVLVDNFLDTKDVLVTSGSTSVALRHNTVGIAAMSDLSGPISGVTIENNLLNRVDAPTQTGSASIHVLGNRFRGNAPSTGWDGSLPDFRWADNTFVDSGAPANP